MSQHGLGVLTNATSRLIWAVTRPTSAEPHRGHSRRNEEQNVTALLERLGPAIEPPGARAGNPCLGNGSLPGEPRGQSGDMNVRRIGVGALIVIASAAVSLSMVLAWPGAAMSPVSAIPDPAPAATPTSPPTTP